jgi:hypothetical protein
LIYLSIVVYSAFLFGAIDNFGGSSTIFVERCGLNALPNVPTVRFLGEAGSRNILSTGSEGPEQFRGAEDMALFE